MNWSELSVHGPAQSTHKHSMVASGSRMIITGGAYFTAPQQGAGTGGVPQQGKECFSPMRYLDCECMSWVCPRETGDLPGPRKGHTSVTTSTGRLLLFGGAGATGAQGSMFLFDEKTSDWSSLNTTGDLPSARRAHTMTCLPENGKLYVYGGTNGTPMGDLYELDQETLVWSAVHAKNAPAARAYHSMTARQDSLVLFGGTDGSLCYNDVHCFDPRANTFVQQKTAHTPARFGHAAVGVGPWMFAIGGCDGSAYKSDIHVLDIEKFEWVHNLEITGRGPSPLAYHAAALYGPRIIVYGGYDGRRALSDVHALDLASYSWLTLRDKPSKPVDQPNTGR